MKIKYWFLELKYTTVAFSVMTTLHIILYVSLSEKTEFIIATFIFSYAHITWGGYIYNNPTFSEFQQSPQGDEKNQKKAFKFVGFILMQAIFLILLTDI